MDRTGWISLEEWSIMLRSVSQIMDYIDSYINNILVLLVLKKENVENLFMLI